MFSVEYGFYFIEWSGKYLYFTCGEATNEIYVFFHFTIETIFNKKHLNFLFITYNRFSKEVYFTFSKLSLCSSFVP